VQEEIGVRGATVSSYDIDPDVGIAIDVTLAVDTPGVPDEEQITKLGEGAAIKILDSYSVSDKDLVDEFIDIAESNDIPHQFEILPLGGTDAGALQRAKAGCKAITISVPTRYVHTVTETLHKDDLHAALDLLTRYLEA
jgi:endoglucanase